MPAKHIILIPAILLSACATSAPPMPAPSPLFSGKAGIQSVKDTAKAMPSGSFTKGDVFAEHSVKYTRTGRLTADANYTSGYLGTSKKSIPAGTEVYAVPYGSSYGGYKSRVSNLGWCAPGKDKSWLTGSNKDIPVCMFWHDGKQAKYIEGLPSQSAYYAPRLNATNPDYGEIPEIKEDSGIDFGRDLQFRAKFGEVDKKDFDVTIEFFDGDKGVFMRSLEPKKDENGEATLRLWGGEFKLKETDPENEDVASIEVIKEPTGASMSPEAVRALLQQLLNAAEAAEKAKALENAPPTSTANDI